MQKTSKSRILFVLYNLVVVAIFLAVLEMLFGYWLHHPTKIPEGLLPAYRAYYNRHLRSTIQMEPECARYDSGLFYTLRPGHCTFKNIEFENSFTVNGSGLRDDEQSLNNPSIVFLGDSYTMGWGIPQDQTYAALLEQRLKQPVLNAGISSYGTAREVKLLDRLDIDMPGIIVMQYHETDLEENQQFLEQGGHLPISSEEVYNETSVRHRGRTGYFFGRHTAMVLKYALKDLLGKMEPVKATRADDARYFADVIHQMPPHDSTHLVIFEIQNYAQPDSAFTQALRDHRATLLETFRSVHIVEVPSHLAEDDFYILDNHINPSGHRKIADLLAPTLESLLQKNPRSRERPRGM